MTFADLEPLAKQAGVAMDAVREHYAQNGRSVVRTAGWLKSTSPSRPAPVVLEVPRLVRVRFDRVRLHPIYLAVWRSVDEMAKRKRDRRVVTTLDAIGTRAAQWLGRVVATDTVRCALVYLDDVGAIKVESWPKAYRGQWGRIRQTRLALTVPVLDRERLAHLQVLIDHQPVMSANPKEAVRKQKSLVRQRTTVSGTSAPGVVKVETPEVPENTR